MTKRIFLIFTYTIFINLLNAQTLKIFDDFETYTNFEITKIGNWTMIDNDKFITFKILNHSFTNESYTGAFIVFNQSQVNPPLLGWEAHSGDKFLACFSAVNPPNDDWIISQKFVSGKIDTVSFWIKSISSDFDLERYNVFVMNDTTENGIVEKLNSGNEYDEATTEWTEVSFIINNYISDTIRIGIQCVSNDSYCLMIDDFKVSGRKFDGTAQNEIIQKPLVFPNPSSGIININTKIDNAQIFDLNGRFLLSTSSQQIDLSSFDKGIYVLKIKTSNKLFVEKVVLK